MLKNSNNNLMPRVPKQRCENCPARNNRVQRYEIRDPETGTWKGCKVLCSECAHIYDKILIESKDVEEVEQ